MRQTATYIKRGHKNIVYWPFMYQLNFPSTLLVLNIQQTTLADANFRRVLLVLQWVTVQALIKFRQM